MHWAIRRITVLTLLSVYTVLGCIAHLPADGVVSDFVSLRQKVSSPPTSVPLSYRPLWTRTKHLPPTPHFERTVLPRPSSTFRSASRPVYIRPSQHRTARTLHFLPPAKPRDPPLH